LVFEAGRPEARSDDLVTEEPLEVRLRAALASNGNAALSFHGAPGPPRGRRTVAVTMRTPGADFELAAGFLYGEGVLRDREAIDSIAHCDDPGVDETRRFNIVNVDLRSEVLPDLDTLQRHFHMTSACGVCGKTSLDSLRFSAPAPIPAGPKLRAATLTGLPVKLRSAQGLFSATGGLHAAGLFTETGELLAVREDVGRHNAVDKLVGWAFLAGRLPLSACVLMVSGRSSFEILQKAVMAGIPVVCAVSAPSSLAVSVAREFGVTLIGFLRDERFNVYTGFERLESASRSVAQERSSFLPGIDV
jgi:FdhD protein